GCQIPAAWCDAHHIVPWSCGGVTALVNLVLLCPHHHRLIHHSAWEVDIGADGMPVFSPPDWVTPDIATADPTWRILLSARFRRRPRAA
ncbi:MAG TPA: HNH endonuclease signature motif containing protein, partial [Actinomycetes bacterium]|nr:HNH endonuclease signature motif containing protein [Actinomycetes bacterium]